MSTDNKSVTDNTKQLQDWWKNNYEDAIKFVSEYEAPETLVAELYDGNWDIYNQTTSKNIAIDYLHKFGIKAFEEDIKNMKNLDN